MSPPAARTTDFILHSPQTGTDYSIFVAAPAPAREPGPWPAIAFMDGDDQFKYAVAAYRAARDTGEVPPLLLVGVGYGASYTKPGNRRLRDYTPTAIATEPASGGADACSCCMRYSSASHASTVSSPARRRFGGTNTPCCGWRRRSATPPANCPRAYFSASVRRTRLR